MDRFIGSIATRLPPKGGGFGIPVPLGGGGGSSEAGAADEAGVMAGDTGDLSESLAGGETNAAEAAEEAAQQAKQNSALGAVDSSDHGGLFGAGKILFLFFFSNFYIVLTIIFFREDHFFEIFLYKNKNKISLIRCLKR